MLEALVEPPTATPAPVGQVAPTGQPARNIPFVTAPNVPLGNLPALARQQLRDIRRDASAAAAALATAMDRAHWNDIVDRTEKILNPAPGRPAVR